MEVCRTVEGEHNDRGDGTENREVQRSVNQSSPLRSGHVQNVRHTALPIATLNPQCPSNTLRSPTTAPCVFDEAEEF